MYVKFSLFLITSFLFISSTLFPTGAGYPVPSDEGFVVTADGLKLFYQKFGGGTQVVVAPGGMYLAGEF